MERTYVEHTFPPVYDENSRILILGSLPSVKSREEGFYYGHPKNRFWKMLAGVFGDELPATVEEKKAFLLSHRLAVYDVIAGCEIAGSSDSSIRNVRPADLGEILGRAPIRKILANGRTAGKYFKKYQKEEYQGLLVELPSTSPANAAVSLEQLVKRWGEELWKESLL